MWGDTLLYCGVGAERGSLYLMRLTDLQTQKVEADVRQLYETYFCGSAAVWRYFDGRDHEIGGLKFFDRTGELPRSRMCPDFPVRVGV